MSEFNIFYRQNNNSLLFQKLGDKDIANIENIQNYIPIYNNFFNLNNENYNKINLNHKWAISNIIEKKTDNIFLAEIIDENKNKRQTEIFFKYSPLLDPLKYLVGKYQEYNHTNLPSISDYSENLREPNILINENKQDNKHIKVADINNTAYTDGFFTYLTSFLVNNYNFIHGIDYYGGFLGIKNNFKYDVGDELEYIDKSKFFHENNNKLFEIDDIDDEMLSLGSRNNKKKININNITESNKLASFNSINSIEELTELFETPLDNTTHDNITIDNTTDNNAINDDAINIIYQDNNISEAKSEDESNSDSSDCSSEEVSDDEEKNKHNKKIKKLKKKLKGRDNNHQSNDISGSVSSNSESDSDSDSGSDSEYNSEDDSCSSTATEDLINANIYKFPVNIICLECCNNTLDKLMVKDELSNKEWASALMQVIMSLITYQKAFNMTHNDLHTNNVMYNHTEKQHIYYCYDGKYYKIPTEGKLYKIIDFGRAIYKFKGKTICSDSFKKGEDAHTQYNIEPYFNNKKPRLEPNMSFDLTRLACSMFDYLIETEDMKDLDKETDPISKVIIDWCKDDKGRNILYKNNGEERYPEFKLYKMIARNVHRHTPQAQLEREIFAKYQVSKKSIPKKARIVNIDKIPSFTE